MKVLKNISTNYQETVAQRVMDCGDTGHILLSKHVAEDLEEYERWRPLVTSKSPSAIHLVAVACAVLSALALELIRASKNSSPRPRRSNIWGAQIAVSPLTPICSRPGARALLGFAKG
jgi:predicted outer membrane lipoprotein